MNQESFSDPETAKLINENFIPVLVDREERPDVDQIYQAAVQFMGHQRRLAAQHFPDAKGVPFFVGGYLPKEERLGQPAFTPRPHRHGARFIATSPKRSRKNAKWSLSS